MQFFSVIIVKRYYRSAFQHFNVISSRILRGKVRKEKLKDD